MSALDYGIVGFFFVFIFAAGAFFYKWVATADDFYVAGRRLTPFILAATLTATNVNLFSFISQAGNASAGGIGMIWQTWTGNMALVLAGLFIIPVMRRLRIRTVPEFLEMRYGRSVRMLAAAVIFLRLAFWLGIIIGLVAVVAQTVTGFREITIGGASFNSWHMWLFLFAFVTIAYTIMGGMWSVALTDVIQFVLMMAGALIVLPLIMSKVGWWPGLSQALPEGHLQLLNPQSRFNWFFVLAIMVLGIQWASTDQGLIQRAFGAKNTKSVAKGMVLAGIITTPFAFLWILPGLASRVFLGQQGIEVPIDEMIPTTLHLLLRPGILGLVLCGLLASQMSTIDSNLTAAATLFVNDIYGRLHKRAPDPKTLLRAVRITTLVAGAFMVFFAYSAAGARSAVNAYLGLIAILDMPLFVIVVLFGFFSKWANLPGALIGYAAGALGGFITMAATGEPGSGLLAGNASLATFISGASAIMGVALGSMIGRLPRPEAVEPVARALRISQEEIDEKDIYHIWPVSSMGRLCIIVLGFAFLVFLAGTFIGRTNGEVGSTVALVGMIAFFAAGLARLAFD